MFVTWGEREVLVLDQHQLVLDHSNTQLADSVLALASNILGGGGKELVERRQRKGRI